MSHGLSRQPCGSGLAFLALLALAFAAPAWCGSIFLTGHDPDFHASVGSDKTGANNLNRIAVDFVANPLFNPFRADDITTLLYVESSLDATGVPNHTNDGAAAVQAAISPGLSSKNTMRAPWTTL